MLYSFNILYSLFYKPDFLPVHLLLRCVGQ